MPLTGFEPATIGLEVQCSILLSYRGNYEKYYILLLGAILCYTGLMPL